MEASILLKINLIILLLFTELFPVPKIKKPHEVFIIIPGTWALKEKWFKIGGKFFEALNTVARKQNKQVIWFRWLTDNYESSRQEGAQELAHFLSCFECETVLHLIAHSHGTNIALGASQILAKQYPERKIATLFALGAPIYEETYAPNMQIINRIYNFYSFNDGIQTIWAYKRIFKPQSNIYNLRTFIENKEPTHAQMHSSTIARWLPLLIELDCPEPGIIHFYKNKPPILEQDINQQQNLANDTPLNLQALFDMRKEISQNRS